MTYEQLTEKRYQLTIELAGIERELLRYNGATLFVDKKRRRKAKPVTASTQLAADWWPDNDLLIKAKEHLPNIEIGTETEKFMNHYMANGKPMKNWEACWKKWLIQANQYQEARS